jgi:hypothetical protein
MARKITFCVEGLEGRALLSGITYSLTTDQSTYQVGQPIQMTFTETNTCNQPATVLVSPTDFSVAEHGGTIWQSDPSNAGQPPTSVTLQPGQSVSQTATWDGTIALSTDQVNQFGTFLVSNPNAPPGDTAIFQITNPLSGALTTDQMDYTVGQPVVVTYSETNTSGQTLTIPITNPLFQIQQNGQPLTPVMDPLPPSYGTIAPGQTLTSQYTWTEDAGFTGQFVAEAYNVPAAPGAFTVDFQIVPPPSSNNGSGNTSDPSTSNNGSGNTSDPSTSNNGSGNTSDPSTGGSTGSTTGATTIGSGEGGPGSPGSVATPVGYLSVSTSKDAYKVGHSVRITMSFNGGGTINDSLPSQKTSELITVMKGSTVVWKASHRIPSAPYKSLRLGQAVELTTVWDGRPNQPGLHGLEPGSYTIDVAYVNYGGSTAITLGRKGS